MDKPRLEGTFLILCSNFTVASLFVAASVLLVALFVQLESGIAHGADAVDDRSVRSSAEALNVHNISLDSVVLTRENPELNRVIVYFSNYSDRAGLVQLKSEYEEASSYGVPMATAMVAAEPALMDDWERRRVPRFDYLVYSVYVPNDLDPSTITLYLRGHDNDAVREFQLASYGVSPSTVYSPVDELYTQNHGG